MKIRPPLNQKDFNLYYDFRWRELRKPLGQVKGSERDDLEKQSYHLMVVDGSKILGVGRVHFVVNNLTKKAQIRYMAIDQKIQKRGYGSLLLKELENIAIKNNVSDIFLHARESAIPFYIRNGYSKIKESHLLLNTIQHWYMEKKNELPI
tara:strand:- start:789 stop:1238 length:450 start_codon:yes stop_codon:yes gene_type:complete